MALIKKTQTENALHSRQRQMSLKTIMTKTLATS